MPAGMPKRHKWELQQLRMLSQTKLEQSINYKALKENESKWERKKQKYQEISRKIEELKR